MVIGLDGSDASRAAARWAAENTERFGPIQPVITWRYPWWIVPNPFPGAPTPPPDQQFQQQAEGQAERELQLLALPHCLPPIVSQGAAGPTLATVGSRAGLIVIGTRGRGALKGTLLGSVGMHLVRHSRVPIAIVPHHPGPDESTDHEGREAAVVVGVDGSRNSVEALRWAIDTTPSNVPIEVVTVFLEAIDASLSTRPAPDDRSLQDAHEILDATIEAALAVSRGRQRDRHLERRVLYGEPADVLREVGAGAEMLVVGTHGYRGVAHLLLGSVTDALVRHPVTTTIVVPDVDAPGIAPS